MTDLARSPEQIGNSIRRARKKAGLSQSALAYKTGLRQATISQIEKGHPAAQIGNDFKYIGCFESGIKNRQ